MNIFKKKLEESASKELPIDPLELFQSLFHKEGYSYLRGIQEEVLKSWHDIRDQRDVLCKMNTGSGKTLVSLLMLYSKMVEGVGPSLYLCPDRQLLEQTKQQALLYGIPVCEIEEGYRNEFPNDFLNSKSILLCTFQRLFTARSIFDRDNIEVGSVVLDDAHVCLDIARTATTIEIPFEHELSKRILKIFDDDLKYQAPGTYQNLLKGDPYAKIMKVPYWAWLSRSDEMLKIIGEYDEDKDMLFFKWGLIADDLKSYDCYIGPNGLEIAPTYVPFHNVRAFNEAKHRYILSATFEDQIDLVKDLGINKESIEHALVPKDRKDVGQRLILAPRRFDTEIDDDDILRTIKDYATSGYNVVVMTPSWERANKWSEIGATIINNKNINESIENLKSSKGGFYVLVNRYDGVDLNGDMCRILVIDGYPSFTSYKQRYSELRLESVKSSLKAQIIEQGLGRAVRSGSDYCTVFLLGKDILQFVGNQSNLQYFTPVTRKQLVLGLSILNDESKENSLETIKETANLCLTQDEDWRKYHSNMLSEIGDDESGERLAENLKIAKIESDAIMSFRNRDFQGASDKVLNEIIDNFKLTSKQRAYYFELAAQLLFQGNTAKSNDLQLKASSTASHMLQSVNGYNYTKISGGEEQAVQVLNFLRQFDTAQDFKIYFENLLEDLQFSPDIHHSKFEASLAEIGRLLGYHSQEPEKEFGNGPDVLWAMTDNFYLILEAKSRAIHNEITRDNIGQLLQSGEWFKKTYGKAANYNLVTLQPPNIKGWNVNPSEETRVIDENALNSLKENLRQFVDGILNYGCKSATSQQIIKLLGIHNLTPSGFRKAYLGKIVIKK